MAGIPVELASNPTSLTIGDGSTGFQVFTMNDFANIGASGFSTTDYAYQQMLLAMLQSIWGVLVAGANGVAGTTASGMGNGAIGIV